MMHRIGNRNDEIKGMQKGLRDAGFFTYKNDTGYFGPQSEKALKEYQRARGIKIDGIYGPRTKNMLSNERYAQSLVTSPHIKGTPYEDILKDMYGKGDHAINLGKGMTVTPEDIQQHYDNLEKEIAPFYPQQYE
jgi:hypothetical protein